MTASVETSVIFGPSFNGRGITPELSDAPEM